MSHLQVFPTLCLLAARCRPFRGDHVWRGVKEHEHCTNSWTLTHFLLSFLSSFLYPSVLFCKSLPPPPPLSLIQLLWRLSHPFHTGTIIHKLLSRIFLLHFPLSSIFISFYPIPPQPALSPTPSPPCTGQTTGPL